MPRRSLITGDRRPATDDRRLARTAGLGIQVSDDERDEIRRLHERRAGLQELLLTVESPDLSPEEREVLRARIDEDLARTNARFEGWWQRAGAKYHLEGAGHGRWMLDFETNELWHETAAGQACHECAPEGCDCC